MIVNKNNIDINILRIEYNVLMNVIKNMENIFKNNIVYKNVLKNMHILNKILIEYVMIHVNIIFLIISNIVIQNVMRNINIMLT